MNILKDIREDIKNMKHKKNKLEVLRNIIAEVNNSTDEINSKWIHVKNGLVNQN